MHSRSAPQSLRLLLLALSALISSAAWAAASPPLTPARSALYVADTGNGFILRCDGVTGTALGTLGHDLVPVGLALGPDNNLYVTSFGTGNIQRFNVATGNSLGTFIPDGSGGLGEPVCMAFGPDGNLYVGNWKHNDIRRYSGKTGAFLGVFAAQGSGGLTSPGDLTFGPDGNLYVTNNGANEVLRFNGRTGAPLGAFVTPGSGGLKNPQNLAFGPNGDLYVGGENGVMQYSGKTGNFVRVFAVPGPHLASVGGLTFGPDGDLYVGDWKNSDIVRYNGKTGDFAGVFASSKDGLAANRYILFGPRGHGGVSLAQALAASAAQMKADAAAQAAPPPLLADGTLAPNFRAFAPDGKPISLSDLRGKPVVLDFWATWCGPCQMSMPHLESVYQQVKNKGVSVLAVCVWDQKAAYAQWVKNKQAVYQFPTAFDPAGSSPQSIATHLYKVSGIPTQYIIGKSGHIRGSHIGYDLNDHWLETTLTKMGYSVKPQQTAAAQ